MKNTALFLLTTSTFVFTPAAQSDYRPDRRSATVIVAASDARTESKLGADLIAAGANDDAVLGQAIALLPAAGGRIQLTEGTFTFGATLAVARDRVTLRGQGAATVLSLDNSTNTPLLAVGSSTRRAHDVRIEGLTIDRRDRLAGFAPAVHVDQAARFAMRGCLLTNVYIGLLVSDADGLRIRDCSFSTTGTCILLGGASDVMVEGNHATDFTRGPGTYSPFVAVTAGGRHGGGTVESNIVIRGNTLRNSPSVAIGINGTTAGTRLENLVVSGNSISDVRNGVQVLHAVRGALVEGNTIQRCTGPGIDVYGAAAEVSIRGNAVHGCAEGIFLGRNAQPTTGAVDVADNTISGNNIGLAAENVHQLRIHGNRFRDNRAAGPGYGLLIQATARELVIEGNHFAEHNGTSGTSWSALITHSPGTPNPVVRGNTFIGGQSSGERGVGFSGTDSDLLLLTNNYFRGYTSVAAAINPGMAGAVYDGSYVEAGGVWTKL